MTPQEYWTTHTTAYRRDRITLEAYAKKHELSLGSLRYWCRKLNPRNPAASPAGSTQTGADRTPAAHQFIALRIQDPLRLTPPNTACTITLAGMILNLPELPPPAWLAALRDALEGAR